MWIFSPIIVSSESFFITFFQKYFFGYNNCNDAWMFYSVE